MMSEHKVNNIPWWYWTIRFDRAAFFAEKRRREAQSRSSLQVAATMAMISAISSRSRISLFGLR